MQLIGNMFAISTRSDNMSKLCVQLVSAVARKLVTAGLKDLGFSNIAGKFGKFGKSENYLCDSNIMVSVSGTNLGWMGG